ncbi:TonB-dependent receptor SusC [termite gut metagenome]|uniref:TonB-dependent receptor SusC n=1 Tax=termite gut metagenome TaxID=433724 RepID=A0A5J4RRP0_9ZZZZ
MFGFKKAKQERLIRIMKSCLLFIFLGIGACFANETYSQKTFFTVEYNNRTVKEIMNEIEQKSEYIFFYLENSLDLNRKVTLKVENEQVEKILDKLFSGTLNRYYISDRQIIIFKGKDELSTTLPIVMQSRSIAGVVRDALGPIAGANIVVKGTTNGSITDMDGKFTLSNIPDNAILQVSFIGYLAQEVRVGNQTNLTITLIEDSKVLDEVVAIGYGSMRKKDITGAVGSISNKEIQEMGGNRIEQILLGKESGVQVKAVSGAPGTAPQIRIRGIGSISAGADPLYVVDGYPTDNIQTLNPSDIESMDILKDASATAIYGSRGSNGVVIINTKRGKAGKPTITVDVSYGLQKVYDIPKMMSGPELAIYGLDGLRNKNTDAGEDVSGHPTTWFYPMPRPSMDVVEGKIVDVQMVDEILRVAPENRYQLNAYGGNESIHYSVSGEYLSQNGVVLNSDFKRYSLRTNLDAKLTDRLLLKLNLNPSFTNEHISDESSSSSYGSYMSASPVNRAQLWPSYFPAVDENGEYFMFDHADGSQEWNPLAQVNEVINNQRRIRFLGNVNLEYKILNELKLNVMLGGNMVSTNLMRFEPELEAFAGGGSHNVVYGRDDSSMGVNWITEYTLHYNKSFSKHNITGLAGFTAQKDWYKTSFLASNRYPNNLIPTLSAVGGVITNGTANINEWSLVSYLARLNYSYNNKYYLTASVRTDGSSRFGSEKKYGFFPSAALSWRVSEEEFLKDVSFLSDLKLRVSFGRTGNNDIGRYEHLATINYNRYTLGGGTIEGYSPGNLSNPYLTWETQDQINTGLDFSILENRLSFNFDYFVSRNTNLLLDVNIPAATGFTNTLKNIGEVKNNGLEFTISSVNIKNEFEWSTDFNISTYKNEVVKLGLSGDPIYSATGMVGGANITMVGHPLGMFYGYLTDGIFLNQAEVDKGPIFGVGTSAQSRPGDIRFVDVSGDGKIDSDDQTIMGNPYPDFFYGMTNHFSYKNLSMSISLQGTYGNDILNLAGVGFLNMRGTRVLQSATQNNYWKSEQDPGDGKTVRPNDSPTGNNRATSQRYIDTGSFLRVNNVSLSYIFPEKIARKLTLSSLQVYLNSTNTFTFTNNKTSFNPDVSNSGNPLTPGVSFSDYPLPKTFLIGLNIGF